MVSSRKPFGFQLSFFSISSWFHGRTFKFFPHLRLRKNQPRLLLCPTMLLFDFNGAVPEIGVSTACEAVFSYALTLCLEKYPLVFISFHSQTCYFQKRSSLSSFVSHFPKSLCMRSCKCWAFHFLYIISSLPRASPLPHGLGWMWMGYLSSPWKTLWDSIQSQLFPWEVKRGDKGV